MAGVNPKTGAWDENYTPTPPANTAVPGSGFYNGEPTAYPSTTTDYAQTATPAASAWSPTPTGTDWSDNPYTFQGDFGNYGEAEEKDGKIYIGGAPTEDQVGGNFYIDPAMGSITYEGLKGKETRYYNYNQDYGLGPDMVGVIPAGRDSTGTVIQFYAGTAGGGGQLFSSAEDAKAARDSYQEWFDNSYSSKNKANPITGASNTQVVAAPPEVSPGQGGTATATKGELTDPGAHEDWWKTHSALYDEPTNAQTTFDQTKWDQPTNSQQLYNGISGIYQDPNHKTEEQKLYDNYAGIYGDPHYLDDYYARQADKAETTLDRKSSSAGWGDSGAAARATGNIQRDFADKALTGMQDFTKTGMSLAGYADTSGNEFYKTGMGLAGSADTSMVNQTGANAAKINAAGGVDTNNLAYLTGGSAASRTAQEAEEGRLTGAITSATTLGNDMATLTEAGFESENARQFATQVDDLALQVQSGKLTADAAYTKASEIMATLGQTMNYATNAYLVSKLGKK